MMTVTSHSAWPGSGAGWTFRSCFGMLGREQLDLDARLGHAVRLQRLGDRLHHAVGPADERGVDAGEVDPVLDQRVGLFRSMRPFRMSMSCGSRLIT